MRVTVRSAKKDRFVKNFSPLHTKLRSQLNAPRAG